MPADAKDEMTDLPYPTCCCRFPADSDEQCDQSATRAINAKPCPTCHPDGQPVLATVCDRCWDNAGRHGIHCHELGHRTARGDAWTIAAA